MRSLSSKKPVREDSRWLPTPQNLPPVGIRLCVNADSCEGKRWFAYVRPARPGPCAQAPPRGGGRARWPSGARRGEAAAVRRWARSASLGGGWWDSRVLALVGAVPIAAYVGRKAKWSATSGPDGRRGCGGAPRRSCGSPGRRHGRPRLVTPRAGWREGAHGRVSCAGKVSVIAPTASAITPDGSRRTRNRSRTGGRRLRQAMGKLHRLCRHELRRGIPGWTGRVLRRPVGSACLRCPSLSEPAARTIVFRPRDS